MRYVFVRLSHPFHRASSGSSREGISAVLLRLKRSQEYHTNTFFNSRREPYFEPAVANFTFYNSTRKIVDLAKLQTGKKETIKKKTVIQFMKLAFWFVGFCSFCRPPRLEYPKRKKNEGKVRSRPTRFCVARLWRRDAGHVELMTFLIRRRLPLSHKLHYVLTHTLCDKV